MLPPLQPLRAFDPTIPDRGELHDMVVHLLDREREHDMTDEGNQDLVHATVDQLCDLLDIA